MTHCQFMATWAPIKMREAFALRPWTFNQTREPLVRMPSDGKASSEIAIPDPTATAMKMNNKPFRIWLIRVSRGRLANIFLVTATTHCQLSVICTNRTAPRTMPTHSWTERPDARGSIRAMVAMSMPVSRMSRPANGIRLKKRCIGNLPANPLRKKHCRGVHRRSVMSASQRRVNAG